MVKERLHDSPSLAAPPTKAQDKDRVRYGFGESNIIFGLYNSHHIELYQLKQEKFYAWNHNI